MVTSPTFTITPIVQPKLRFNPITELVPVALVASVPNVMVIHPKVPAKNFKEFVELARSQPGKYTYGTGGAGASNHFATEQFKMLAHVDLLHIPYQSATHAVTNLVGGQIDMVIGGLPTSAPDTTLLSDTTRPCENLTKLRTNASARSAATYTRFSGTEVNTA